MPQSTNVSPVGGRHPQPNPVATLRDELNLALAAADHLRSLLDTINALGRAAGERR